MSAKLELTKKITKKKVEIETLEKKLAHAKVYLKALEDSLDLFESENQSSLRANSNVAKAKSVIQKTKAPLHINQILKKMGKKVNKKNRVSLASSISAYVRKGRIFKKTAPNTFSLFELESSQQSSINTNHSSKLPLSFGS